MVKRNFAKWTRKRIEKHGCANIEMGPRGVTKTNRLLINSFKFTGTL